MRRLTLLLTLLLATLGGTAQKLEWLSMPKQVWGLRAGARLNDMTLSYDGYGKYNHNLVFGPSLGLYSRHRIAGPLSVRADIVYAVRGMDLEWCDVRYTMKVPSLDLRPMLQLNLSQPWWTVVPYINVGLQCHFILPSGKVDYQSNATPPTSVTLNRNNIRPFDLALWAGVGVDFHFELFKHDIILAIEAGADLGLLNNFASAEQEGDAPVFNLEMEGASNLGERKTRGFELSVALGIPFGNKKAVPIRRADDGGLSLLGSYLPREEKAVTPSTETTATPRTAKSEPKRPILDYEYKECYTLDEILDLLKRNKEVCDLRICLFDIHFAFDSYELTMGSKRRLDRVVQMLQQHPEYNLRVNGHTDSIGSDEYNDRLSFNRASEVANYFILKGVRTSRLSYTGYGERYPIESNATEEGRYRNRRVELELYCTQKEEIEEINDDELWEQ